MWKAFRSTLMFIVGILCIHQFASMIGVLLSGREVDTVTLYVLLGGLIVISIKVVIESVIKWIEAFKGN